MHVFDLRPLRHFVAVAEELHFGRAAERLSMTQPPLSQSIMALEQSLGFQLFTRTKRSVALTPVGAMWLPYVKRVLDEAQDLPRIARRLSRGEIGKLRLSFVSTAVYSVLPSLISTYREHHPEVEIELTEVIGPQQLPVVLNKTTDAGLVIFPPGQIISPSLEHLLVHSDPLMVAAPRSWIERGEISVTNGFVDFASLIDRQLIFFPRERAPGMHSLIWGYYARRGCEPVLGQATHQMQTAISLVSAGLGFSLLPSSMRHLAREGVTYLALADDPPIVEIHLIWLRAFRSPPVDRLLDIATKAVEQSEWGNLSSD